MSTTTIIKQTTTTITIKIQNNFINNQTTQIQTIKFPNSNIKNKYIKSYNLK